MLIFSLATDVFLGKTLERKIERRTQMNVFDLVARFLRNAKMSIFGEKGNNWSEQQKFGIPRIFFRELENRIRSFGPKFRPISEQKYIDTFVALKSWLGGLAAILFAFEYEYAGFESHL